MHYKIIKTKIAWKKNSRKKSWLKISRRKENSEKIFDIFFALARRAPLLSPKGPTVAAEGSSPPQELAKCRP